MQNDKRKVIVNFVRRWGIVLLLAVTLYCCKNESGTPGKVVIVSTNDACTAGSFSSVGYFDSAKKDRRRGSDCG